MSLSFAWRVRTSSSFFLTLLRGHSKTKGKLIEAKILQKRHQPLELMNCHIDNEFLCRRPNGILRYNLETLLTRSA